MVQKFAERDIRRLSKKSSFMYCEVEERPLIFYLFNWMMSSAEKIAYKIEGRHKNIWIVQNIDLDGSS